LKVLVIGGTRFVGLRLVQLLAEQGHEITLLNRGKTQAELPASVSRVYADRRNADEVRRVLQNLEVDVVYDITGYQVSNLEPMVAVLSGKIKHYIFQSTGAVYAPSELLPVREDFPTITPENAPPGEAVYALEKEQCERFLLEKFTENGFPVTIFRSPVIYGPENWMDEREGSYFVRLLQARPILVPGNGSTVLHYAHVDDVARAYIAATGKKNVLGEIYNIASDEAITINGYIDTIARVIGADVKKVYIEQQVALNLKRPIFFFRYDRSVFYDTSKAKRDFGYRPIFNMEEGIRQTYQWWQEKRGIDGISFTPGKMGHDVDLTFEDEVIARYG